VKISKVSVSHLPGPRYSWVFVHIDTGGGIRSLGQVSSGSTVPTSLWTARRVGRVHDASVDVASRSVAIWEETNVTRPSTFSA